MINTRYNYDHGIPCQNPNCRSYGRPHPNCKCGGGGLRDVVGRGIEKARNFASGVAESYGNSGSYEGFASGGAVDGDEHYCARGLAHAEGCEHYADGGTVEANQAFAADPSLSLDHAILANGLLHTLTKTGHSRSEDPGKVPGDFMEAAKRGRKALDGHAKNLLNPKAEPIEPNKDDADALGAHLDAIQMNPSLAENVGGNLGDSLPDHQLQLAGKLASTLNYFSSIKPKSAQGASLDKVMPPSQKEMHHYRRQLEVAQNPALVYQRAKEAQLQPGDLNTLQSVYPKLHQQMVNKAGDAIVDHKTQGLELPKHAKHGLGMLMQQNLGFCQTPAAMQAIISANAPSEPPRKDKGTPAKAVDESNKQAQIEATADQSRRLDRKTQ